VESQPRTKWKESQPTREFAHYDIVCDAEFSVRNFVFFRTMLRIRGFANTHRCKENILKLTALFIPRKNSQ